MMQEPQDRKLEGVTHMRWIVAVGLVLNLVALAEIYYGAILVPESKEKLILDVTKELNSTVKSCFILLEGYRTQPEKLGTVK